MEPKRKLISILVGLSISSAVGVLGTPHAIAGTHSADGWDFSWDDALLISPSQGTELCRTVPITWANNTGKRWLALDVEVTGTDNQPNRVIGANRIGIDPGETGTFDLKVCAPEWISNPKMVPGGVARVAASSRGYSSTDVPVTTSFDLTFLEPVKIPDIAPQREVCVVDSINLDDPSLCEGPFYLKLHGALTAQGDSERPRVDLFNKQGRVPITVRHEDFNGILVTPRSFPKGNYLVTTSNYSQGKWTCSLYFYDVCRWADTEKDVTAYTFTWDGTKITKIKWVPAKKIRKVRL